jgi:hypothetical protein
MLSKGHPFLNTLHTIKHGPHYLEVTTKLHLLHQTTSSHYYKNGVQFTSLNHYGTLKVK